MRPTNGFLKVVMENDSQYDATARLLARELLEARAEIKSLRFDVKAQPIYKSIIEKAQRTGSTAEIVACIRVAELSAENERMKNLLGEWEVSDE